MGCEGEKGEQGPPGNPNIEVYDIALNSNSWVQEGPSGTPNNAYVAEMYIGNLTVNRLIDGVLVQVYLAAGNNTYLSVPCTFTNDGYSSHFNYIISPNLVELIKLDTDLLTVPFFTNVNVRVIIAPRYMKTAELDAYMEETYGVQVNPAAQ